MSERAFLIGLEKLSRETGIEIAGCGCCGSPFLVPLKPESMSPEAGYGDDDRVLWVSPDDEYVWLKCRHTIVKETPL